MKEKSCPKCKKQTLKHSHNLAHGIPGTHMAGSEIIKCECGYFCDMKQQAEKDGLEFYLDV